MACMHVSRLHTVFYISAHLKKQYDGWLDYSSDEGAMVAAWASLVKYSTVFDVSVSMSCYTLRE